MQYSSRGRSAHPPPHAEAEVALGIFSVAPCPLGARPELALALAAADAEIDAAVEAEPHGLTAKAGRMIARAAVAAVAAAGLLLVPESAAAVLLKVFVVLVLILAPRVDCGRDCCGGGGGGGRAWPLLQAEPAPEPEPDDIVIGLVFCSMWSVVGGRYRKA